MMTGCVLAAVCAINVAAVVVTAPPEARELLVWSVEQTAGEGMVQQARAEPQMAAFFDALSSNEAWMRELLDSGPVENGPRVLGFLAELWIDDPSLADRPIDRSMATACALELRAKDRNEGWMKSRYEYFRDHYNEGLLNLCYDDLATWERRFLARGAQYTSWTAPEALQYLRERICWPRAEYTGACWQAPYRSFNCFGDTVQGWLYYHPFRGAYRCDPEMAINVGGVCGALSNTGASAAIANGIPALTMGEPGHCAYAVQTAPGVWTPAYSLSWKRSLHSALQRRTWPSLILAQRSLEQRKAVHESGDQWRLARWYEAQGDIARAEATYRKAISRNGLDEELWTEYLEFGGRHDMDALWWQQAVRLIQRKLLPDHPEPAWVLLKQHVYSHLFKDAPPKARTALLMRFIAQLDGWGPARWDIESAWGWMIGRAGEDRQKRQFILNMLRTLVDSPQLGPAYIAWASTQMTEDEDAQRMFERVLLSQTGTVGEGKDAALRQLARRMLPASADQHDLATFQRIGKAASRLYAPRATLAESGIEPFEGSLLSSGGALRIWQPGNRWDSPESHWGVLEEHGGNFHTQVGELPWFEIELPHFGTIEGIVLEGRRGQAHRANGARILVSDDGTEWEQVATLNGSHIWYRVDLSATKPRARFVRVERDGKCMHFPRVLIYGRKAS